MQCQYCVKVAGVNVKLVVNVWVEVEEYYMWVRKVSLPYMVSVSLGQWGCVGSEEGGEAGCDRGWLGEYNNSAF